MSDSTQGPGWWQASDGKWYPPEQHPDFQAPTEAIPEAALPTQAMPVPPPPAPPPGPPPGPIGPPVGPPPGAPVGGPPPGAGNSNAKWIAVGAIAAVIIAIAAFLLLRDDDKEKVASTSSSPSASSSSTSSSSSRSSSTSSSSTSSSSGPLSESDVKKRLLTAKEVGPGFQDETFTPTNDPTPCGQPDIDSQVPSELDVGNRATSGEAAFLEEVIFYESPEDAQQAIALFKQGISCPEPTVAQGAPAAFGPPEDVSSDVDISVDEAFEVDFQTEEAQGKVFVIRDAGAVVVFQFVAANTADVTKLPVEIDIVNKGLNKLVS